MHGVVRGCSRMYVDVLSPEEAPAWDEDKIVLESVESSLGFVEIESRSKNKWFDKECGRNVENCNDKRGEWLEDIANENLEYRSVRREVKRVMHREMKEHINRTLMEVERDRVEGRLRAAVSRNQTDQEWA